MQRYSATTAAAREIRSNMLWLVFASKKNPARVYSGGVKPGGGQEIFTCEQPKDEKFQVHTVELLYLFPIPGMPP